MRAKAHTMLGATTPGETTPGASRHPLSNRRGHRTLSWLLVAIVLLALLPMMAFPAMAEEDEPFVLEIPYTKIVEQGGNVAPGSETFKIELFDFGATFAYTLQGDTIATDGAGSYYGLLSIEAESEEDLLNLYEGFYVREAIGTSAGWEYSNAVWHVQPIEDSFDLCEVIEVAEDEFIHEEADEMVFVNIFTEYVLEIPFTKTVVQGGNVAPGSETFKFELFDFGAIVDFTVLGDIIATKGAGNYDGVIRIKTRSEEDYWNLYEGFYVREIKGGKTGWTYSDTIWYVQPIEEEDTFGFCKVIEVEEDEFLFEEADEMVYINTYTVNRSNPNPTPTPTPSPTEPPVEPIEPTFAPLDPPPTNPPADPVVPEEPQDPANPPISPPETGDNGNVLMWLLFGGASLFAFGRMMVTGKRKTTETKTDWKGLNSK